MATLADRLFGELDLGSPAAVAGEFAELFPDAELVVQPRAGHFPWLDDADRFVATTAAFLGWGPTHAAYQAR